MWRRRQTRRAADRRTDEVGPREGYRARRFQPEQADRRTDEVGPREGCN
jgi:hypothetical protein